MSPGREQNQHQPNEFTPERAIRLKREDPVGLFIAFARAALNAQWNVFIPCLSRVCDISERAVVVMFENIDARDSWKKLYDFSNMPAPLFPAFLELLHLHLMDRQASANHADLSIADRGLILNRLKQEGMAKEILSELID